MKVFLKFKDADNELTVNVNLKESTGLSIIKEQEYNNRVINKDSGLIPLDNTIELLILVNGVEVAGNVIGTIVDPVYSNRHMLIYSDVLEVLFVIPNPLDYFGLFKSYSIDVNGVILGGNDIVRNDITSNTLNINQRQPVKEEYKKFKLDVTKLSDITVEAVALNYPGLIKQGNLPAPIYIEKVTDGNIKYDNTYVALGLNIDFKDSIITDTFNVNIIHGHDNKNNRSRTVNINKSNLVDFKTLYVIE